MKFLILIVLTLGVYCSETAYAQPIPQFKDYPARVVATRRSVKVNIRSTPDSVCFRTMLRKTARKGQLFAGRYAVDYWGCGTCIRIGIVDLITGRTYVTPYEITPSAPDNIVKAKTDSRLLLVAHSEAPGGYLYYLWTGQHLLPIYDGKVERSEPQREFTPCSEIPRYTANEKALLGRVVEKQSGYGSVEETRRAFADEAARAETIIERKDDQLIATFVLPQGRFYSVMRVEDTQLYQTYAHSLDDALAYEKLRRRKR